MLKHFSRTKFLPKVSIVYNICIDTMPTLLEGEVLLCGRDLLYKDTDKLVYPPDQYLFDAWGCVGRFDKSKVGKSVLPL